MWLVCLEMLHAAHSKRSDVQFNCSSVSPSISEWMEAPTSQKPGSSERPLWEPVASPVNRYLPFSGLPARSLGRSVAAVKYWHCAALQSWTLVVTDYERQPDLAKRYPRHPGGTELFATQRVFTYVANIQLPGGADHAIKRPGPIGTACCPQFPVVRGIRVTSAITAAPAATIAVTRNADHLWVRTRN